MSRVSEEKEVSPEELRTRIAAKELEKEALEALGGFTRCLNVFSAGGKPKKQEEASELYAQAAAQWKIINDWKNAGRCFVEAGKLADRAKLDHQALSYYIEAAKSYKNVDLKEAAKWYNYVTARCIVANKHNVAAKHYADLAGLYEEAGNAREAMKNFAASAECYDAIKFTTNADQMRLRVADFAADQRDYKQAISIYEAVSASSADNNLTRWSIKEYLFKASLCHLATVSDADRFSALIQAGNTFRKYCEMYPQCEGSLEFKLVKNLACTLETHDEKTYSSHVADFTKVQRLDAWKMNLLERVRGAMRARGEKEALRAMNDGANSSAGDNDVLREMNGGDIKADL